MWEEISKMFSQWHRHKGAFGLIANLIAGNRKRIRILVLLSGICSVITVISSLFVRRIIDGAGSGDDVISLVLYWCLLALSCVCAFFLARYRKRTGEEMYRQTERAFFESVLYKEWLIISSYQTGDLLSRMEDDGGQIVGFAANTYPGFLSALVKLLFVIPVVAAVSPVLLLFLLGVALVSALAMGAIRAKILPLQRAAREEEAKVSAGSNEAFSNLLTIRSLGKERYFLDKWDIISRKRLDNVNKRNDFQTEAGLLFDFLTTVGYFSVFAWALLMLGNGQITYGTMSMLLVLQGYIQGPVAEIVEVFPQMIWTSVSADRLNEISGVELIGPDASDSLKSGPAGIRVDEISFAYGERKVLEDFSLDIRPGEFVSLQGPSGAGKTTLLMLLLNMLHPDKGAIFFYNNSGETVPAGRGTRKSIGYVPQKNTLFKGTIRENICLCLPEGTEADDDRIRQALYMADALEFVSALDRGVDTKLGEKGIGLSEGQAQRLAIARAVMSRPEVLIFDEATSALDSAAERRILERIASAEPRPTILFTTHREASDRFADRIVHIGTDMTGSGPLS